MSLRRSILRLAQQQPQLREGLLPLLKKAAPPSALQSLAKEVFEDQARTILPKLVKALIAAANDADNYIVRQVTQADKSTFQNLADDAEKAQHERRDVKGTVAAYTTGVIRYPLKSMRRAMRTRVSGRDFLIIESKLETMVLNRHFPKVWSWVIIEHAEWPRVGRVIDDEETWEDWMAQESNVGAWDILFPDWDNLAVPPRRIRADTRQITFPFRAKFTATAEWAWAPIE